MVRHAFRLDGRAAAGGVLLWVALGVGATTIAGRGSTRNQKGVSMTKHASGTFDVKIVPQKDEGIGDPTIGRMSIDKQYHGDLEGTGLGQMLAGMAAEVKDSGAYVAIERVRGTLQGRKGSFAVWHRGVMTRGAQDLADHRDSRQRDRRADRHHGHDDDRHPDGKHFYGLDYTIP